MFQLTTMSALVCMIVLLSMPDADSLSSRLERTGLGEAASTCRCILEEAVREGRISPGRFEGTVPIEVELAPWRLDVVILSPGPRRRDDREADLPSIRVEVTRPGRPSGRPLSSNPPARR